VELTLEPGAYVVIPTAYESGEESTFRLSVFSTEAETKLALIPV
jgi:hypothetical protein